MTIGMGGHSPSNILHNLKGMDFPAGKQDLIRQAEKNGAERDVMDVLNQMPEERYASMADVLKGIGRVE